MVTIQGLILIKQLFEHVLEELDHMTKTLLYVSHDIILFLWYIAYEIEDITLVVWAELEICTEHLGFIDQIVWAHNFLYLNDHGSYDTSIDI